MTAWDGRGWIIDTTRTTIETPAMMTTKQNERIALLEVQVEALKDVVQHLIGRINLTGRE